ncbi:DUF262 domain-containing HNH endonuclease family protein [Parabacteroides sp. OttesenSCG-928-B22]|nr:DUF262 domain-containing HNH endonuclease family protein [Parabacteroides sp. OttesenSCG-928-B22]
MNTNTNTNKDNKFTPEDIANSEMYFTIPLYQRLFAWKEREVEKMLMDLKEHFEKLEDDSPYYLGMLTCIKRGNRYDLIDGQQRFTVMALFAIVFQGMEKRWSDFLKGGERLDFIARTNDKKYLKALSLGTPYKDYTNKSMENGLNAIRKFLDEKFATEEDKLTYIRNVFTKLTFFISYLPDTYLNNPSSLNKYFEAMNAQGRGLEQHEILKVQLMRNEKNQEMLTKIWNVVSVMDKPIIPKKEDMDISSYRAIYKNAIAECSIGRYDEALKKCREFADENADAFTIDDIEPQKNNFSSHIKEDGEDSIIKFTEFLLLVLDISTGDNKPFDFYKEDKLLERFDSKRGELNVQRFYHALLHYRLLFDFYVIRREFRGGQGVYILTYKDSDTDKTADCLRQYQSMLHVSSYSFYHWLKPYLESLHEKKISSSSEMLTFLKALDNDRHPNVPEGEQLCYGKIDRYWFWRLDYYLWEQREKWFIDKERQSIVSQYVFRENRSIEHFHPQDESYNDKWDSSAIDSFGNLAMISQSFNSQQSNDHIQVKFARIHEQINNKSLQSLKMYMMCIKANFNYNEWTMDLVKEHEEEMIELLKNSYMTT